MEPLRHRQDMFLNIDLRCILEQLAEHILYEDEHLCQDFLIVDLKVDMWTPVYMCESL